MLVWFHPIKNSVFYNLRKCYTSLHFVSKYLKILLHFKFFVRRQHMFISASISVSFVFFTWSFDSWAWCTRLFTVQKLCPMGGRSQAVGFTWASRMLVPGMPPFSNLPTSLSFLLYFLTLRDIYYSIVLFLVNVL